MDRQHSDVARANAWHLLVLLVNAVQPSVDAEAFVKCCAFKYVLALSAQDVERPFAYAVMATLSGNKLDSATVSIAILSRRLAVPADLP